MHLIVAEKNISARRIAQILAGNEKLKEEKEGGVSVYRFDNTALIGLRGHVVEVDFVEGYSNWRSAERTPRSLIDADTIKVPTEKKIVSLVQKLAKKSDRVTIATDFDTEGELIGKEAYELVRQVNKDVNVDRAKFSAITPEEIGQAFSHPTSIDFALAAAGEARQVIDLMWGASLTRFISLAARRGGNNILSVGRVQSPTLAMIVDREREIEAFVPEKYWQLSLDTEKNGEVIEARHATSRFTDKDLATQAKERTREPLKVAEVKEGARVERAPTPFDTTAFIVAAARLGFSAANAMRLAEDLYMNGFISYPRTDNTVYPPSLDLNGVLKAVHPTEFRKDVEWVMGHRRSVPTSGKKSSTDHPPIHPSSAANREQLGEDRWKIYALVVRRFLATLSPDARWRTMKVTFRAGGEEYAATGGQLTDKGWRTVYPYSSATEYELPVLKEGETLPILEVRMDEKETQPPPRYSQSKLIQSMEELGLGTKSTRHEVIQKLITRKYIEGNPLRPSLVGRAVIQSLEGHADTITRPDMTQTLEEHMQQIRDRKRPRDDVVMESRHMLHQVFNQLEAHEQQIGEEIMDQTAEELRLGPCPVCGNDLRIRHLRSQTQFIGCTGYPECSFNISLPMAMWGFAVRTDEVCARHGLHHVRLIKKGARPWEIGCPLCHHIATNKETMELLPSMTPPLYDRMITAHIYSVYDLTTLAPEVLEQKVGINRELAVKLNDEAKEVFELIRRRSDCRKFVRKHLPPRRGRSHATIMKKLHELGVDDIEALAGADPAVLRKAGIGEKETELLQGEARKLAGERELRGLGIPPVSLKKYLSAGFLSAEALLASNQVFIAYKTGISPDTVYRHIELVATARGKPAPKKIPKAQIERGREELLAVPGLGESALEKLYRAGIFDGQRLMEKNAVDIAQKSGLPEEKVRDLQKMIRAPKERS
jgi:DNA topoisomerase-1